MVPMIEQNTPFAEVTESALNTWRAQCWNWEVMPAYGTVLTIETPQRVLFGLVHELSTGSYDTHRTVFAYQKNEEELKREHPHIYEYLQTSFTCLTLGYLEKNQVHYQLSPEPPKIHAFVKPATRDQLVQLFSYDHYLHTLFAHAHQIFSLDDLLLALLKSMSHHQLLTHERFGRFVETFSLLTANDYRRLKLFLQRAEQVLEIKR